MLFKNWADKTEDAITKAIQVIAFSSPPKRTIERLENKIKIQTLRFNFSLFRS